MFLAIGIYIESFKDHGVAESDDKRDGACREELACRQATVPTQARMKLEAHEEECIRLKVCCAYERVLYTLHILNFLKWASTPPLA